MKGVTVEYQHKAVISSSRDAGILISALEAHRSNITSFEPEDHRERMALDSERQRIQGLIDELRPVYRGRRSGG